MTEALVATARALVGAGRGLLAMDESNPTCNKRFAAAGIPQTVEARRAIVQQPALGIWRGDEANVTAAQQGLLHRARCDHAALRGTYRQTMEKQPPDRLAS